LERDEIAAYLALAQVPGIGAARLHTLVAAFGSAGAALHAPRGAIAALPGLNRSGAGAIRAVSRAAGHEILDELDRLGAAPGVEVLHTLTRSQPPGWRGHTRRIDREMLAEVAWPPADRPRAFVCGPTRLVEHVATELVGLGYEPARVKTERFGPTGA
jgi:hypothetical protein